MADLKAFSNRIKELRNSLKMTQKEFADSIGVSTVSLSAYENDSKRPSIDVAINIAEKYKISADWLLGLSDIKTKEATPIKINTYSDFMKLMFAIDNTELHCIRNDAHHRTNPDAGNTYSTSGIAFTDPVIQYLNKCWEKTHSLYREGTIDETIYIGWKEKILKDFDVKILNDVMEYQDFYSVYNQPIFSNEYEQMLTSLQSL